MDINSILNLIHNPGFQAISLVILCIFGFTIIILLWRNLATYKSLEQSFAKVGHIAREDTKKYFDEAAKQSISIYQEGIEKNKVAIESTIDKVIKESGGIIKDVLEKAEKDASVIIMEAHENAENIRNEARNEAKKYFERLVDKSVEAYDWSFSQFAKEKMTLKAHEDLIDRLIKIFLDEHRDL